MEMLLIYNQHHLMFLLKEHVVFTLFFFNKEPAVQNLFTNQYASTPYFTQVRKMQFHVYAVK
jgi:hypothetical protein